MGSIFAVCDGREEPFLESYVVYAVNVWLESFAELKHCACEVEGSFCLVARFEVDFAFGIDVLEGLN